MPQISELDLHLAARAETFGIVAVARTIQNHGGHRLELRAAAWRNRHLHSHVHELRAGDFDLQGAKIVAERFIDHVNALFSGHQAVSGGLEVGDAKATPPLMGRTTST
jgi:hypothetical protein